MTSRLQLVAATVSVVALAAAGAVLMTMFDPGAVVRAVQGADVSLLLLAMAVGAVIQAMRAQRAALMLRQEHPITLEQSFGAQVLSHAVSSVLPIGPTCFGLQSLLTRRLANIPMPFSMGVFIACSILERLTAIPLIALVLFTMHLPQWVKFILLGTLLQNLVSLLLPVIAALMRARVGQIAPHSAWAKKIVGAVAEIENGLATIVAGGWRVALPTVALSFLIALGGILRLALLLGAFELGASVRQLGLLMLMGGLVGSMPVKLPGADAWATGKLLRLTHVVGPGAGGFVLLFSVITTLESPLLAAGVLLWWALPRSDVSLRLGELVSLAQQTGSGPPPARDVV